MRINVLFFAAARDLAGTSETTLELPSGSTVGAVRRRLGELHPRLAALLVRSALAVDERFAEDEEKLAEGATVAVLPPVSGG